MIRFPSPFTGPLVDPDPETICTLTVAHWTVGLPPTPDDTYVGASTAVPELQLGVAPVPPEVTGFPAVLGTHSQPGFNAQAAGAAMQNTIVAANATFASLHISTPSATA